MFVRIAGAAALALAASTSSLLAADLGRPAPAYAPPPVMAAAPVADWTGLYLGASFGYGGDRFEYPITAPGGTGQLSVTSSGFLGGGQAGYNMQFSPNWVAGIEADINASGVEGRLRASSPAIGAITAGSQIEWFGTVRGRLGYLVTPQLLAYATGGLAYGETRTSLNGALIAGPAIAFNASSTDVGWTAGGGLEYAISPNLSVKSEYAYVDLGRSNVFNGGGVNINVDSHIHTFKVGLNYHFK